MKDETQNDGGFIERIPLSPTIRSRVNRVVNSGVSSDKTESFPAAVNWYIWTHVRPDFILRHLDWPSAKVVARTWCVWFLLTVFIVISRIGDWVGPATYLLMLASVVELSGGYSVGGALMTSLIDISFVLYGFMHICVSSAINWSIHGYMSQQDAMNIVVNAGLCSPGDSDCLTDVLHTGYFLDVRSTVITVIAMLVALTVLGFPCERNNLLFLQPWMMTSVTMIITGSYTNFTPWYDPWSYGRGAIVAMGIAFSTRVFFSLTLFPVTSSYKFTTILQEAAAGLHEVYEAWYEHQPLPSDPSFAVEFDARADRIYQILRSFGLVELDGLVSRFEIAYSRLEPADLAEFRSLLRLLLDTMSGYQFFYDAVGGSNVPVKELDKLVNVAMMDFDRMGRLSLDVLCEVAKWLEAANEFRIWGLIPGYRRKYQNIQVEKATALREALTALENVLDEDKHDPAIPMEPLYATFSFTTRQVAMRTRNLASYCAELDSLRSAPRWIWGPLTSMGESTSQESKGPRWESEYAEDWTNNNIQSFRMAPSPRRRDPDATEPTTLIHRLGRWLLWARDIANNRLFWFNLKRSTLIVLVMSIHFFRPTLKWAYENRLLWAAILTGFSVQRQALDGIYGWCVKAWFTLFGALVGGFAWYISTGDGHGSPYGLCATMGVIFIPLAFYRHFNKHIISMGSMIFGVTIVLVVYTSWSNEHTLLPGSKTGKGVHIAWLRFVSVLVGLTVGLIGTLFPRAYTAKQAIRHILGTNLGSLGEMQALITEFGVQRMTNHSIRIMGHNDPIGKENIRILSDSEMVNHIRDALEWEPPLGGVWPRDHYELLMKLEREAAQQYGHIHHLLDIAKPEDIGRLLEMVGWTNAELSGVLYTTLYAVGEALDAAEPLPPVMPGPLSDMFERHLEKAGIGVERSPEVLVGAVIAAAIHENIDGIVAIVKSLVGDLFSIDPSTYCTKHEESSSLLNDTPTPSDSNPSS